MAWEPERPLSDSDLLSLRRDFDVLRERAKDPGASEYREGPAFLMADKELLRQDAIRRQHGLPDSRELLKRMQSSHAQEA